MDIENKETSVHENMEQKREKNEHYMHEVSQEFDPKREEKLRNDCSLRFYEFREVFNKAIMSYSAYESAQARLSLHLVKKKQAETQPDLFTQNNNENANV